MKISALIVTMVVSTFVPETSSAANTPCSGVDVRLSGLQVVDGRQLGSFAVRNEGTYSIKFELWKDAEVPDGSTVQRMILHPTSYNVHSRIRGQDDWIPNLTIGSFALPDGELTIDVGRSAEVLVPLANVFYMPRQEAGEFFVALYDRSSGCQASSDVFGRGDLRYGEGD